MTQETHIKTAFERRKQISYGITLLATGLLIYLLFGLNTEAGLLTTFGLNLAGTKAIPIGDLIVPAQATVYLMSAIAAFCWRLPTGTWRALHRRVAGHRGIHIRCCLPHLGGGRQIL
jgi:hypothetical protein